MTTLEKMHSVNEVAALLGFGSQTIKRWIYDNKIKAVKVNSQWRIREAEVKRLQGNGHTDSNG